MGIVGHCLALSAIVGHFRHSGSLAPCLVLTRAPYVLYAVKYIHLVPVVTTRCGLVPIVIRVSLTSNRDLGRAPYILYGVKYIALYID